MPFVPGRRFARDDSVRPESSTAIRRRTPAGRRDMTFVTIQLSVDDRPPIRGGNTLTTSPSVRRLSSEAYFPFTRTILGRSSGIQSPVRRACTVSGASMSTRSADRTTCCGRKSRKVAKSLTVTFTLHPSPVPPAQKGEGQCAPAQRCGWWPLRSPASGRRVGAVPHVAGSVQAVPE
jgi:hypothetical protein